jgi:hypothetical protein
MEKIILPLKSDKNKEYFTRRPIYMYIYIYYISLSSSQNKKCFWRNNRENKNTLFTFIFFLENHAIRDIMWINIVQPDRPQKTIWRMSIACWIPTPTNTHPQYVILFFHCINGCTNAPQCYVIAYVCCLCWFSFRFILHSTGGYIAHAFEEAPLNKVINKHETRRSMI